MLVDMAVSIHDCLGQKKICKFTVTCCKKIRVGRHHIFTTPELELLIYYQNNDPIHVEKHCLKAKIGHLK